MKKVLYIFFVVGLIISLQSCDRVSNMLGDRNESQQERTSEGDASLDAGAPESNGDSAKTADMQARLEQKDSVIKVLTDSLSIVAENVASLQSDFQNMKKQQDELQSDKVGVKNLFVYLTIFTVVFVILVILLVRKLVKSTSMKEDKVKGIVEYMAKQHPEIVCRSVNPLLNQHAGAINSLLRDMQMLKSQVGKLPGNKVGGKSEDRHDNQQSWESQATSNSHAFTGQASPKSNVFYMKRPNENMEFDLSLKSLNRTEETLYRFELDAKLPNFAKFYFDCESPARVRWALSTKDKTLDRVCNATGDSTNGRYTCTSPGEAKLQDGKWIVTRKAVVIFD